MSKFPKIETARLFLRIPETSDSQSGLNFHKDNEEHLKSWEPVRPNHFFTKIFWEELIEKAQKEFLVNQSLKLFCFEKNSKKLIGMANFTGFEYGPFQSCRLGYKIDQTFEGKGYMYEALKGANKYVFDQLNLHRIEANYIPRNLRSGNLLKRLGFKINGQEDQYIRINGKWETHVLTSLINQDWEK